MKHALFHATAPILVCCGLLAACSSAPKPPDGIYASRNEAARYIDLAAKAGRQGIKGESLRFYEEAYRLSTAVDDPSGRVAALDGLVSAYASDAPQVVAPLPSAAPISAPTAGSWGDAPKDAAACRALAAAVAAASGRPELVARAALLDAEAALRAGSPDDLSRAAELSAAAVAGLGADSMERARALRALAAARKGTGDTAGALAALSSAAALDKKSKRFTEYAADRYLAASIQSKLGDFVSAKASLLDALANDRRAENAAGIGADYRALAIVAEKAGDGAAAVRLYAASRDVFAAARFAADAADAERRRIEAAKNAGIAETVE